jgi:hypothetical protein
MQSLLSKIISTNSLVPILLFSLLISLGNNSSAQSTVYTQNTSGPSICDGAAWLDSTYFQSTTSWMGNGVVLQQGGLYIGNLCPGTYVVSANTISGTSVTLTFTIGSGTNPCANFSVSVAFTDASSSTACDGTAQAYVTGGTPSYTYTWTGNGMTNSIWSWNNLCTGTYNVCVSDANGCVTCENVTIADASASDSVLTFYNTPFPGGVVVGVLAADSVEDCSLNYQNVYNASVTNTSVIAVDSILVTWTLADSLGNTVATYNVPYYVPNSINGIYNLSLVVYCFQKSTNYNTIVINDQILFGSNALDNLTSENVVVVNPFNNELKITFTKAKSGNLLLFDSSGHKVRELSFNDQPELILNTDNLARGSYQLVINTDAQTLVKKILK